MLRYAVTRFNESELAFGHGQVDAFEEAAFIVMRTLQLPLQRLDFFADAYLTHGEINGLLQIIERRVKKRLPAAYLLNEAWLQGYQVLRRRARDHPAYLHRRTAATTICIRGYRTSTRSPMCSTCAPDRAAWPSWRPISFRHAKVDAVDSSAEALQVAARNVSDYHFDDRITLIKSDLFAALTNKRYDLILCNPPYVTDAAMARLPKEYAHEPKVALAGGPDGMRLVKTIVRQARGYMKRGGVLIVEVGDGRAAAEKAFGDLSLTWLTTSAGDDMVFLRVIKSSFRSSCCD